MSKSDGNYFLDSQAEHDSTQGSGSGSSQESNRWDLNDPWINNSHLSSSNYSSSSEGTYSGSSSGYSLSDSSQSAQETSWSQSSTITVGSSQGTIVIGSSDEEYSSSQNSSQPEVKVEKEDDYKYGGWQNSDYNSQREDYSQNSSQEDNDYYSSAQRR